jgi:hypothetical protein
VILGDPAELATAKQVASTIAHISDDHPRTQDGGGHQRRTHPVGRRLLVGAGEHRLVGGCKGVHEHTIGRLIGRGGRDGLQEFMGGDVACSGACGMTAHAVGDC